MNEEKLVAYIASISLSLGRIAGALDRISPPLVTRPTSPPADIDALTVVTPALRLKWQKEDEQRRTDPQEIEKALRKQNVG